MLFKPLYQISFTYKQEVKLLNNVIYINKFTTLVVHY
jgi:hypothetical protein